LVSALSSDFGIGPCTYIKFWHWSLQFINFLVLIILLSPSLKKGKTNDVPHEPVVQRHMTH